MEYASKMDVLSKKEKEDTRSKYTAREEEVILNKFIKKIRFGQLQSKFEVFLDLGIRITLHYL